MTDREWRLVFPMTPTQRAEVWTNAEGGEIVICARVHILNEAGQWTPTQNGLSLPAATAVEVAGALIAEARMLVGAETN
jgi:hypothetical protein